MNATLLRDADPARGLGADATSPDARAMLADILAQPRPAHRHRAMQMPRGPVRRVLVGGVLAGALATVALAAPMPWDGGGSGLGSSAYAVTRGDDGSVHIAVRWSQLTDPAGLQRALDRAGARTKVIVHTVGTGPLCIAPANTVGYSSTAVQWQSPGSADGGILVHPARFPKNGTFVIGVDLAPPGVQGGSTFAPGRPQIESFSGSMVVGAVPTCVP